MGGCVGTRCPAVQPPANRLRRGLLLGVTSPSPAPIRIAGACVAGPASVSACLCVCVCACISRLTQRDLAAVRSAGLLPSFEGGTAGQLSSPAQAALLDAHMRAHRVRGHLPSTLATRGRNAHTAAAKSRLGSRKGESRTLATGSRSHHQVRCKRHGTRADTQVAGAPTLAENRPLGRDARNTYPRVLHTPELCGREN